MESVVLEKSERVRLEDSERVRLEESVRAGLKESVSAVMCSLGDQSFICFVMCDREFITYSSYVSPGVCIFLSSLSCLSFIPLLFV